MGCPMSLSDVKGYFQLACLLAPRLFFGDFHAKVLHRLDYDPDFVISIL
jgi:hypothetical protein